MLCACFSRPNATLIVKKELGMDQNYAEVSTWRCACCGQSWLKYFYELEAFTASGRWYLGAITAELAEQLIALDAKATLESLDWYFCGGSYFNGRIGRAAGIIVLP